MACFINIRFVNKISIENKLRLFSPLLSKQLRYWEEASCYQDCSFHEQTKRAIIHCCVCSDIVLIAGARRDSQLTFCFCDLGGWLRITEVQCCWTSFSKHPYAEGEESRCCYAAYVGFMPAWDSSVLQKSSAACSRQLAVPLTWRWLPSAGTWTLGWRSIDYSCWLQGGLNFSLDIYLWCVVFCHVLSHKFTCFTCKFDTMLSVMLPK